VVHRITSKYSAKVLWRWMDHHRFVSLLGRALLEIYTWWQPLPSFASETRTVRSCCQTHRGRSSKPDPSDLLWSTRRCPTISWLETRSWSTSYHLDPSDLPRHGNISDRRSTAGRRSLVLATNRNGEMLRLNASRRWWWWQTSTSVDTRWPCHSNLPTTWSF